MQNRRETVRSADSDYNIKNILGKKNYGNIESKIIFLAGAGGIVSNLAYALRGCGFKNFRIIDGDKINSRNIQLSSPFHIEDIGKNKAEVLRQRLLSKNEDINVMAFNQWDYETDPSLIESANLVVIGVDSNAARERINSLCVARKKPIVNLGFYGWEAAFTFIIPHLTVCWSCLFRPSSVDDEEVKKLQARNMCPQPEPNVPGGVVKATIDRLVGFAASQILKWFTKSGRVAQYYTFNAVSEEYDLRFLDSTNFLKPDPECPVCQNKRVMIDIGNYIKN